MVQGGELKHCISKEFCDGNVVQRWAHSAEYLELLGSARKYQVSHLALLNRTALTMYKGEGRSICEASENAHHHRKGRSLKSRYSFQR